MWFMYDFELIGFIELGLDVLMMQDPEMTTTDLEELYEHDGSISFDEVVSNLKIGWEEEEDRPEWQALGGDYGYPAARAHSRAQACAFAFGTLNRLDRSCDRSII